MYLVVIDSLMLSFALQNVARLSKKVLCLFFFFFFFKVVYMQNILELEKFCQLLISYSIYNCEKKNIRFK